MRTLPTLLALVLLCLCFRSAAAQEKKPASEQKDPQAAYEPRSEPGAGQKFLEKFVGDWDVAKTFYPRSGDPVRQQGECRQTLIHGGRFLQSEFTFRRGGETTTGTGLLGFDPASGLFTSVWIDSRSTRMSFRQGQEKFDGQQIVLHSRSLGDDGKKGRVSRTVTRLEDNDRKIVHRQYTADEGGKERLMMELILTRKNQAEDKPLPPVEARKKIGEKITVEMTVRAAKDRLEKRGEIYLDAETDFRDEKNFAVVITKAGAASLKVAGIDNPAEHFKDKKIHATGTVKEVDKVPRIEIDDAKQLGLADGK
jgi:hypothetical protein